MILELIAKLKYYKADYDLLITNYYDAMPIYFIEEAGKAILERAPNNTEQFFKLLNSLSRGQTFPEEGLTYDLMILQLTNNAEEIEKLIELSKNEKEIMGIGGKGAHNLYPLIKVAIRNIASTAQFAESILNGAKLSRGEEL